MISALLAVQLLFGLGYSTSKIVVGVFPPLVWASLRVLIAAVLMFGVALAAKRPAPVLNREYLRSIFLFSLLGVAINQSAFLVGLNYTTATNSAILNTLIPVFTILIVTVRGLEPFNLNKGVGFLFALVGVLLLCHVENLQLGDRTLMGDMLAIIRCLSYAFFLSYSKPFFTRNDPFWATAWLFLFGGCCISLVALPQYESLVLPSLTPTIWACVAYTIIGTTLLSYFLNSWSLAHARSSHVALFGYAQPVVAALVAWAWQGEEITLRTIASCALIFAGLALGLQRGALRLRLPAGRRAKVAIGAMEYPLNDISSSGFSILLPAEADVPFSEGKRCQMRCEPFPGLKLDCEAEAVSLIAMKADGGQVRVGFQFVGLPAELGARITKEVYLNAPRAWFHGWARKRASESR